MSGTKTPDKKRASAVETENNTSPDKRKMKKQKTDAPAQAAGSNKPKQGGGGGQPQPKKKANAGAAAGGAKPDQKSGDKKVKQQKPKAVEAAAAEAESDAVSTNEETEVEVDAESLQKIDDIQSSLSHITAKWSYDAMVLERKYNKERAPLYKKRAETIATIPHFWLQCFVNHSGIRSVLEDEDIPIFKLLNTFELTDLKEPAVGYTITMTFKPNPFFTNSKLQKTYQFEKPSATAAAAAAEKDDDDSTSESGTCKITCTKIDWKDKEFPENNPSSFIVQWFDSDACQTETTEDALADAFREEVWKNPLLLYVQALGDSDDDGAGGDGGDDDDDDADAIEFGADGSAAAADDD